MDFEVEEEVLTLEVDEVSEAADPSTDEDEDPTENVNEDRETRPSATPTINMGTE